MGEKEQIKIIEDPFSGYEVMWSDNTAKKTDPKFPGGDAFQNFLEPLPVYSDGTLILLDEEGDAV